MKQYLKNEIKHIPLVLILFILFYGITTLATTTLFNSSEVKYNNTTSGIQSDKVQGAIDELYACASNYGAYNTRLTNTENTIGTGSLTTTNKTLIGGVNELNGKLTKKISKSISFRTSDGNAKLFDATDSANKVVLAVVITGTGYSGYPAPVVFKAWTDGSWYVKSTTFATKDWSVTTGTYSADIYYIEV